MRPLRLVMRGFGAYAAEQALDFSALGRDALFLIHGPTGAGKTTVLDAICFALYGVTSGGERDGRQMRSHHAPPEVPTEVVFDFALGEQAYRIERSPDQERAARRGTGTITQPAAGCLWRLDGADVAQEVLAAKATQVTAAVERLLGFKADQFRQVVVLPQGRFRQVLSADSRERERLMEVLFGTEELNALQEALKDRAVALRRDASRLEELRSLLLSQAAVEDEPALVVRRTEAAAEREAVAGHLVGLRARERAARDALEGGRTVLAKLRELADAEAAVRALVADDAAFQAREAELALARRAAELEGGRAGLAAAEARARDAAAAADAAERRQREAAAALESAAARFTAEEARAAEREAARGEVGHLTALADRLPEAFAAKARHAAAETARQSAAAERDGLERELAALDRTAEAAATALSGAREAHLRLDGLRQQARELERARDNRQELEVRRRELAAARAGLADAERDAATARSRRDELRGCLEDRERAWRAGQAGVLAEALAEGEPCPVCGSSHHPAPASRPAGVPGEAELDGARRDLGDAEGECERLTAAAAERDRSVAEALARAAAIEASLGERAGTAVGELADLAARVRRDAEAAAQAASRLDELERGAHEREGRRVELVSRLDEARARLERVGPAAATAQAELAAALAELSPELREAPDLDAARHRLDRQRQAAEARRRALDEAVACARAGHAEAEKALSAASATLQAAQENAGRTTREAQVTLERFGSQVTATGFDDLAAFEAARRSRAEIDALDAEVERAREARSNARDRLERARRAAEGLGLPDLAGLEEAVAAAAAAADAALRRETELRELARQLGELADRLAGVNGELEQLRRRYAVLGRVADVANGVGNAYRITFQRFVLGALLDEVLDAASQRLRLMSQHRYTLRRAAPGGDRRRHAGLELEVDDAYTGRARAVETLSGGEGFLASLALALGLADVVQTRAGGLRLETVFIDEGFGALDPEALDLALRALIDLRRGGRLVGVISHVPELRERIDVRLEVTKAERGSTARFVLP